jgi:hypothetical protein
MFDLQTGESPGNTEMLQTYRCRFENDHWYVGVSPEEWAAHTKSTAAVAMDHGISSGNDGCDHSVVVADVDVDMAASDESLAKRVRTEPTPTRILAHHPTVI